MGCELEVYRARIGSWAASWRGGGVLRRKSSGPVLNAFFVLVIAVLLVIGGVELNPGPVENKETAVEKCGECKKNLRTGLLCSYCAKWFHFSCQKIKRDQRVEENWRCKECVKDGGKMAVHLQELTRLQEQVKELQAKLEQSEERARYLEEENRRILQLRREKDEPQKKISCLVVGDSIIRHVGEQNSELTVECFPGIRTDELKQEVERGEKVNTEKIIVHVGTNDLKRKSVDYIMGDLYDLAMATRQRYPTAKIIISGVVRRRDVHWRKIGRTNEAFEWVAERLGFLFVDPNSWLDDMDLGRDGVHLNRRGSAALGALFARVASSGSKKTDDSGYQ